MAERQLGVDAAALGEHVRDDGATDWWQSVGRQSVQQSSGVATPKFQFAERRQVDYACRLHHHSTLANYRLKPVQRKGKKRKGKWTCTAPIVSIPRPLSAQM